MTETLDKRWWASYRRELEQSFAQNEIVIRATALRNYNYKWLDLEDIVHDAVGVISRHARGNFLSRSWIIISASAELSLRRTGSIFASLRSSPSLD